MMAASAPLIGGPNKGYALIINQQLKFGSKKDKQCYIVSFLVSISYDY